MRILFVTRRFPPSVGGMERYAYDLYNALSTQADIVLIKSHAKRWSVLWIYPYFFLRCCWALLTKRVDVIHMQDGVLSVMGVVLKALFRRPLCIIIHGLDITYKNRFYQWIVPLALKRADHVTCISRAAYDEVLSRGVTKDKLSFKPLGVTDDLFMHDREAARQAVLDTLAIEDSASPLLLSVGRLVKRKGMHWFIDEVMPDLIEHEPTIRLLVSGDGPYRQPIKQLVARKQLQDHVYILGRTDDRLKQQLYNGCDVYVMPNIPIPGDMEGFGRVLSEAALCELPIVASGIEGIKDAISHNNNGILVPAQDKDAYVKAIMRLLGKPKSASGFGRKARTYTLKHFNWLTIAQDFITTYESVIKTSR